MTYEHDHTENDAITRAVLALLEVQKLTEVNEARLDVTLTLTGDEGGTERYDLCHFDSKTGKPVDINFNQGTTSFFATPMLDVLARLAVRDCTDRFLDMFDDDEDGEKDHGSDCKERAGVEIADFLEKEFGQFKDDEDR